ncbi:MAG: TonB-dependent receptor, partial [Bacteroidetes bacterium]
HQLELGYNTFVKGVVLSGALYFRHTDDIIESIQTLLEGEPVAVTTFENVGYNNSLGFNFFTSFTIKEIWTLRGNFNVSTYATRSRLEGLNRTNDGLVYNGFFNSSLKLKHGIQADGFIMFNSPRRTLQGTNPSFSMYSIGIRKELFQKKGSIGIRMVTPFHRTKSFNSELEGQGFYQQSLFSIPFRSYGVSFSYRFGKLDFKAQQRKSKIKNDDLKQGGDQQGGSQF